MMRESYDLGHVNLVLAVTAGSLRGFGGSSALPAGRTLQRIPPEHHSAKYVLETPSPPMDLLGFSVGVFGD